MQSLKPSELFLCCLAPTKMSMQPVFYGDKLSLTHFLPSSSFNTVPVFFLCPSFSLSLFSPGIDRESVNLLCVSVFTSVQSQTPLAGTVNPQEMALFGSTAPPSCLGCQAKVRHQMRLLGFKPKCFFYQHFFKRFTFGISASI